MDPIKLTIDGKEVVTTKGKTVIEAAADIGIRWRFEGTRGTAVGTIGWPGWPDRVPSTIDYTTVDDGRWHRPRWTEAWFPDAFAGPMAGLMIALETGAEPDISGRSNLGTIALCEAVLRAAAASSRVSRARCTSSVHSRCSWCRRGGAAFTAARGGSRC